VHALARLLPGLLLAIPSKRRWCRRIRVGSSNGGYPCVAAAPATGSLSVRWGKRGAASGRSCHQPPVVRSAQIGDGRRSRPRTRRGYRNRGIAQACADGAPGAEAVALAPAAHSWIWASAAVSLTGTAAVDTPTVRMHDIRHWVIGARRSDRDRETLCADSRRPGSAACGCRVRTLWPGRRAPTESDFRFRAEEKVAFGLAARTAARGGEAGTNASLRGISRVSRVRERQRSRVRSQAWISRCFFQGLARRGSQRTSCSVMRSISPTNVVATRRACSRRRSGSPCRTGATCTTRSSRRYQRRRSGPRGSLRSGRLRGRRDDRRPERIDTPGRHDLDHPGPSTTATHLHVGGHPVGLRESSGDGRHATRGPRCGRAIGRLRPLAGWNDRHRCGGG
jgi:hypothetical protein